MYINMVIYANLCLQSLYSGDKSFLSCWSTEFYILWPYHIFWKGPKRTQFMELDKTAYFSRNFLKPGGKIAFFFFNFFILKLTETGIWGGNEKGLKKGVELLAKSPFWEGHEAPGWGSGWWGEPWRLRRPLMEAPCRKVKQIQQTKIRYNLGTFTLLTIPHTPVTIFKWGKGFLT